MLLRTNWIVVLVVLLRFPMIGLQSSYVHYIGDSHAMVTVPLSCTFSIKYEPACDNGNLGRIPGLLSKTRSPTLYLLIFNLL